MPLPPSNCDLATHYGALAASLPLDYRNGPDFLFDTRSVSAPPGHLSTNRILIRKTHHDYNGWVRADALWMFLTAETCRQLGVILISCGLHGPPSRSTLRLTHPESGIRQIILREGMQHRLDSPCGLRMAPVAFGYWPQPERKHPWMYDRCTCRLPLLALSNEEDWVGADHEWAARDTIWIESEHPGTFRLAELLLNAGSPSNEVFEYALEGEAGYRSVAPMSTELKIYLPGADFWIDPSDPSI